MKVSYVIPTRNQVAYIRRCIDGCLAQGIPDSEIVVVDGLSTDGTQDVLGSYGSSIAWVSERDEGQADAVNKGVARSRGEIIAWINSDDFYSDETSVREVVAAFEGDDRLDVVYGGALMLDEQGDLIRPYRSRALQSPADLLCAAVPPAMQPAIFFRRRLFEEVGGLRPDLHYAMDYDLWLRMFPRARSVRRLERTLACATFHPGAKSVSGMWRQVRELGDIKRAHRLRIQLGGLEWVRFHAGIASLYAYWVAVRLGLRRAV